MKEVDKRQELEGELLANQIVEKDVLQICDRLKPYKDILRDKKILVTGGTGFIGSWFCDVACRFESKVLCVDNLSTSNVESIDTLLLKPNFSFVKKDILDYDFSGMKFDYIVHLASIASPSMYQKNPIATLDTGILATKKLLDLCAIGDSTLVLASSSEIYGDTHKNYIPTEETYFGYTNSYGPRSMYDESKRAAEAYCYAYRKDLGVKTRIARIFNTYGPRLDYYQTDKDSRVLAKFIKKAIKEEDVTLYNNGENTRSFCYISDLITGLYQLMLVNNIDGEVINLGNKTECSIRELASLIVRFTNSSSRIIYDCMPDYNLLLDPERREPNLTKAERLLGYKPETNLINGLKKTISWFINKQKNG
ncbi:MAG: NAD-dependent epimerase/dehydratase family protein [Patescibacteria group bacterium]